MKLFTRFESDRFAWRDAHLGTRPRVTPNPGLARLYGKHTEPAKLDSFAQDERLLHAVEDRVDGRFCLRPRKSGPLNNSLNKILLDQDGDAFPLSL